MRGKSSSRFDDQLTEQLASVQDPSEANRNDYARQVQLRSEKSRSLLDEALKAGASLKKVQN